MWVALKNVETGIIHAVLLPGGMSPHGFAMDWPLEETKEPLSCHLCLQYAFGRRHKDAGLRAMLPAQAVGPVVAERRCQICKAPVSQCCR
jgi:hypothetical protein